jgi:calcium-dependent protein kinase
VRQALEFDPLKRPTALELLEHPWMEANSNAGLVSDQAQLDIANNLEDFKASTTFQSGILSFIVGLKSTSQELDELNRMFVMLDTSKDGILSIDEIKEGLDKVLGQIGGNKHNYKDLILALDQDGNGVIDY